MKRNHTSSTGPPLERRQHAQSGAAIPSDPVQEALADRAFMDGVRESMAETDPPVRLREIQEQERAQRADRRV